MELGEMYKKLNKYASKRKLPQRKKIKKPLLYGAFIYFENKICKIDCYKFLFRNKDAYPTIRIVINTNNGKKERSLKHDFDFISNFKKFRSHIKTLRVVEQYIKSYVYSLRDGKETSIKYPSKEIRRFLSAYHIYNIEGKIIKEYNLHDYLLTFKNNRL